MITWLDRLRGSGQGRSVPESFTPPDGEYVFILGAEGQPEPAVLSDGDFTEVKQVVDLTDWDLVVATMDTVGQVMSQAQPPSGFPSDYSPLWHFNYNIGLPTARNLVTGGFTVDDQGDIEVDNENYSPLLTRCRRIPVGSTSAKLLGQNTPQWFSGSPLDNYTFQMWVNFDAVAHAGSSGISPILFKCADATPNGVNFGLSGTFGPSAHQWVVSVVHHAAGTTSTTFPGFVWDTPNPGWKLVTVTWDLSIVTPGDRLKLYIDDNPTPYLGAAPLAGSPNAAAVATPLEIADPDLWGLIDEMRMLDVTLSPTEIAASYDACTVFSTPIDFEWLMQIIINGEIYGERVVRPDESRRWTDFKAPVRHLNGDCEVAFRLALQEI